MAYKEKSNAIAYNNKFNSKAYDRINLTVPKGKKELIQAGAQQTGESVNGFIWRLVQAELDRLGESSPEQEGQQRAGGGSGFSGDFSSGK